MTETATAGGDPQAGDPPANDPKPDDPPADQPAAKKDDDPKPPWGSEEEFDPDKAWKLIQNLRGDLEELKPKAAKLQELEDAQKSDQEKLAEELQAAKSGESSAKTEAAKLRAAIKHGLSEDDLELLGDGSPEQIEERAEKLAARIGSEPVVPVTRRQGGEGKAPSQSPEELADAVMKRQRGY